MLTCQEIALSFKNRADEKDLPGISKVWTYLAERGVTEEDAGKLGLHIMPAVELVAAARKSKQVMAADGRAAIIFPHYRVTDMENPIGWWSARMVEVQPPPLKLVKSIADFTEKKALSKMFCPPMEAPHGYVVPAFVDWTQLKYGDKVYIHESCIKAINGAKLGKYSIGLNGVWGWGSEAHQVALIQELKDLPWKTQNLQPVIIFDSNVASNWLVKLAAMRLGERLTMITGQKSYTLTLPKRDDGEDWGFDDYVQCYGSEKGLEFLDGELQEIEISDLRTKMIELNTKVCVVRSLGRIAEQETGTLMTKSVFTEVNYSTWNVKQVVKEKEENFSVPRAWLAWDERVEVEALEYEPGGPLIAENMNLWRGMGVVPEPGEVAPWLDVLASNLGDEELRDYILKWLAYPLQNLGAKLSTNLLIFGPPGTGKNQFFNPIHKIYGLGINSILISNAELKSNFNSVYSNKQFIHIDELKKLRPEENGEITQKLKLMVTDPTVRVNMKGQPEYTVANHANLVITSNYWDCVRLDVDDRRMAVIRFEPQPGGDRRGDEKYWTSYTHWWDQEGGAEVVFDYLRNYDLTGFNPQGWAPFTSWKEDVTESGASAIELWLRDLSKNPNSVLSSVYEGKCLMTAKQLATEFWSGSEITESRTRIMSAALRNENFKQAADGSYLRLKDSVTRYWVIRRTEESWKDRNKCMEHLKKVYR